MGELGEELWGLAGGVGGRGTACLSGVESNLLRVTVVARE